MDIGIDEVGRGSLAGPLVIGAVSLSQPIRGLKDSKDLSALQRQNLAKLIYKTASYAQLGWVWPHEIDSIGLTQTTTLAIKRALKQLRFEPSNIIIDGNFNYLKDYSNVITMIKADSLIADVSAASIIAKVARDNYMVEMSQYFAGYGFNEHVGYGTKSHFRSIKDHGPCALHRLSFKPLTSTLA